MGITRTVTTRVKCDKCGEYVVGWYMNMSKEWAKYYARMKGATVGKEGVKCKECRIAEKQKKCSLIKKLGRPGEKADGTCKGITYVGEPMEPRCKKCIAYTEFNWKEEKEKIRNRKKR